VIFHLQSAPVRWWVRNRFIGWRPPDRLTISLRLSFGGGEENRIQRCLKSVKGGDGGSGGQSQSGGTVMDLS
jgi:hypothetical protein